MPKILIVEDDRDLADSLAHALKAVGHRVDTVTEVATGIQQAIQETYDVVVTDLQFTRERIGGLELIQQLHAANPLLPIILMTAYPSTQTVIEATKYGAHEYIPKGADTIEALLPAIERAVERTRPPKETEVLSVESLIQDSIVGNSPAMREVYKAIGRLSRAPVTVLIRGETGTGKELVARALHSHSDRAKQPFIPVNCVAIPETLLESELFGHEPGAFTGAIARRIGCFEQANDGTIFLDEIGDMTRNTQAKLLRVLQDKTIQRLGGRETISVNGRVVAATHCNLEEAIRDGSFRQDLYYRLSVAVIHLPPLRQRLDDIPDLVTFFVQRHGADLGSPNVPIAKEAIQDLQQHSWPGNVRELENVVRRALNLALGHTITRPVIREALAQAVPRAAPSQPIGDYLADLLDRAEKGTMENVQAAMVWDLERELYALAIRRSKGNQALAARWLGVSRPTMREKLRLYRLASRADDETDSQ